MKLTDLTITLKDGRVISGVSKWGDCYVVPNTGGSVNYHHREVKSVSADREDIGYYRIGDGPLQPIPQQADRHNEGKVDHTTHYIPALEAEARVWMKSREKYPDRADGTPNWHALWGDDTTKVACASALRHIFAILGGEVLDKESGEHHAAHVRCNMAMLIKHWEDKNATS